MQCLVRQPDSVIIEVQVDTKAKGKQCLDRVCSVLGVIEADYLGLQFAGPGGERLWLNLRNQIRRQVPGPPPYRLQLRVKFFVPPHLVLQDITRRHFYLDVREAFLEGRLRAPSSEQNCRLAALLAQVDTGDEDQQSTPALSYARFLPPNCTMDCSEQQPHIRVRWRSGGSDEEIPSGDTSEEDQHQVSIETDESSATQACQQVQHEHSLLRGTKASAAIYRFLQEASELEDFGVEHCFVKNKTGETLRAGVGPAGMLIHDLHFNLRHSIPYATILAAEQAGRCFALSFAQEGGGCGELQLKLESCPAASALYRALTEKHAFYSCETVRNAVTTQYIRDLKGTIASLFNENTPLGKNYVFDIQRTCREVYDHTRRVLYKAPPSDTAQQPQDTPQDCSSHACKVAREELHALRDSLLCRVCMDADVDSVFFPCRHVACCRTCATECVACPLCRTSVTDTQFLYLPHRLPAPSL